MSSWTSCRLGSMVARQDENWCGSVFSQGGPHSSAQSIPSRTRKVTRYGLALVNSQFAVTPALAWRMYVFTQMPCGTHAIYLDELSLIRSSSAFAPVYSRNSVTLVSSALRNIVAASSHRSCKSRYSPT